MGNFIKDKKRGEVGERIVKNILTASYPKEDIIKAEGKNSDYDFAVLQRAHPESSLSDKFTYFEVKYDEMARDTGNICFEVSNGTKLTGIFASKSDWIFYIVPSKLANTYEVFKMDRIKLIAWLKSNEGLTRAVNGGDKSKFSLLLVKKGVLLAHINEIGQHMTWVEGA